MNQNSAGVSKNSSVKTELIPFPEIPGQSKLFLDFQIDSQLIDNFYPEKHRSVKDFAEKVLANYTVDRNDLCDALLSTNKEFGAKIKTFLNIELLRAKDCVAVVTGQQAGLFSGPIYTVFKALSAIKMAKELRDQNIKAVPVFWIAEEDHDFDEVKQTFVIDKDGKLTAFENSPKNYSENFPTGFVRLDKTIEETIEDLFSELPVTEFSGELKKTLRDSYQPGQSYSSAFAKLLMKLFADYGLILLTPLNKTFKKLSSPILTKAVERSGEIVAGLLQIGKILEQETYHTQVLVENNSFPFFLQNEGGERRALRRDLTTGRIKVQNSTTELELQELVQMAQTKPEFLSPNALLRPVVQDFLLPTITYFGGAAEIAYFAQNAVIYQILDRPVTPIRNRSSFTIIEGKHHRSLENYHLSFRDLYNGRENVLAYIVENFLAGETAGVFNDVEEVINLQLDLLTRQLLEADPTLADNLENRRKKIIWHIGALRKKYHRAEIFKNEVASRRMEDLFTAVFPHNALQERSVNAVTFLNLYGRYFIEWIYQAIETDEKRHKILYL